MKSLKECIVSGKRVVEKPSDRHVDATAFWKREFEKSEKEKMQLKTKLFLLEHDKENLAVVKMEEASQPSNRKRKAATTSVNARAKRQRVTKASNYDLQCEKIIEDLRRERNHSSSIYRKRLIEARLDRNIKHFQVLEF